MKRKKSNHVKRRKRKNKRKTALLFLIFVLAGTYGYFNYIKQPVITSEDIPGWITQDLIYEADVKEKNMDRVRDIVIHYTANPGSTAKQNRDYFAQNTTVVNSHFVVGIQGEIIQCVPLYMQSVASNNRNNDTISIEVCHPNSSGEFTLASYNATVKLTAWLCDTYNISRSSVIRHGDITGKNCPKYFMEHPDEWEEFKTYVKNYKL